MKNTFPGKFFIEIDTPLYEPEIQKPKKHNIKNLYLIEGYFIKVNQL